MADRGRLDELLRAEDSDAGCDATQEILDVYVDMELSGEDASRTHPGVAIHLDSCSACRADYEGLVEAARRLGNAEPE